MSEECFIIADIAGEFDALMRLVKHAPTGCPILAVGDIVDRGPQSAEVIEWLMKTPHADSLMGNHEHMMIDYYRKTGIYGHGVWLMNGGDKTRRSYEDYPNEVPDAHVEWLASRPWHKFIDDGKCLVTHAPLHPKHTVESASFDVPINDPEFDNTLIWNRYEPKKRDYFQVFGHNAGWGVRPFGETEEEGAFALCIDQSFKRILTAFHWPTMEIFEEPYVTADEAAKKVMREHKHLLEQLND